MCACVCGICVFVCVSVCVCNVWWVLVGVMDVMWDYTSYGAC